MATFSASMKCVLLLPGIIAFLSMMLLSRHFPKEIIFAFKPWSWKARKRLKRNPRLIGNIGADGPAIMANGSMMQNAPTVGLSIPLFVAEMHPISFINSVLIAVAIWDIRRFDIYG